MNRTERRAATARPNAHELVFTADEFFALQCLANCVITGIQWTGGDADELELRFRQGKMSLKARLTALALPAEPPKESTNGDTAKT